MPRECDGYADFEDLLAHHPQSGCETSPPQNHHRPARQVENGAILRIEEAGQVGLLIRVAERLTQFLDMTRTKLGRTTLS